MNPRCATAVKAAAAAAGKALTKAQVQSIDDQLSSMMRQLARTDPQWQSKPYDQQLSEAGVALMKEIRDAAQRKADNALRQIAKTAESNERLVTLQEDFTGTQHHTGTRVEALKADLVNTGHDITGIRKIAMGGMMKMIDAANDKAGANVGRRFLMSLFDAENPVMTRDIGREIFRNADGSTSNKAATAAARSWLDTIETLRTRFNAAGGDVGKLDYGWLPNMWDTAKVRAKRDAFAQFILPRVDRSKYLREDGSRMDDAEVFNVLNESSETLVSEGRNKHEPGSFSGSGKRANRGSEHRVIHFKDGDSWAEAMAEFGRGSLYDGMLSHIGGMSRDIGLVERFGPDPNANFRLQLDLASAEDGKNVNNLVGITEVDPNTYWNMLTGKTGAPVNERFANTMSTVRNLQGAAKLGSAIISSVTDLGSLAITAGYHRLPYWQLMKDIGAQGSKDSREFMATHGMIAESAADAISKWSGDNISSSWSGKLLNSVLRASFLNAWTDGLRQGFTLTMNAGLAKWTRTQWGNLSEFDRSKFTRAGFTEADWAHLNTVQPVSFKGRELLTPESVGRSDLAAKVFGFIHDESEYAIVNPDMAARAYTTGGQHGQAGSGVGEIVRTVMQFKSFPIAMMTRHWSRMLEGDHNADGAPMLANRVTYGMAMLVTTTGLGAVAFQAKQIRDGHDMMNMTGDKAASFWTRAVLQGGGLSIAGDFLLSPGNGYGDEAANTVKNLLGPTVGTVSDLAIKNIKGNIMQASDGKETHWEAELAKWGTQQTPGLNLWWLKPMMDHGFMNAMNENLSPGYLSRMEARTMENFGSRHWWRPNETLPERMPEYSE